MDALTMRSIAERAQVSVPTIYNLIGGRSQVLSALMDAGGDRLDSLLAGSGGGDPTDRMVDACEALAAVVEPNAAVVTAVLAEGVAAPGGGDGLFARYASVTRAALADARSSGLLESSADPDLLTERCVALAAGAVISWATGHRNEARLRDELVHGAMVVLAAQADGDAQTRAHHELDRRTRRLIRHRSAASRRGVPRSSKAAR